MSCGGICSEILINRLIRSINEFICHQRGMSLKRGTMKQTQTNIMGTPSTDLLADFLNFINKARSFLKRNKVSKLHPDVLRIRGEVEAADEQDNNQSVKYQNFESTLFEDAQILVTLLGLFHTYDDEKLHRFHKLTLMELNGLTGDFHPMAILGRSILGTGGLILGGVTVFWGLIRLLSGDDMAKLFPAFLTTVLSAAMVNRIAGLIYLAGIFVFIWYLLRMVRNRKQVAFLSSLSRALEIYLELNSGEN